MTWKVNKGGQRCRGQMMVLWTSMFEMKIMKGQSEETRKKNKKEQEKGKKKKEISKRGGRKY